MGSGADGPVTGGDESHGTDLLGVRAHGPALQVRLAGCVIRDEGARILLLHRRTPRRQHFEIPGGKIEPGEDAAAAAAREAKEELDVDVELSGLLGTCTFLEDGVLMVYTWFGARITAGVPRPVERRVHDSVGFHGTADLAAVAGTLSPSTTLLLAEIAAGRVTLDDIPVSRT